MLVNAMLEDYPDLPITGYVMNAFITCYCVIGRVYKSSDHRDGGPIISEEITKILEFGQRYVVETADGKRYLLVNFHPSGGRKSLAFLLSMFASAAMAGSRYCVH